MRLVAALEPRFVLPSVVCEPPNPASHAVQRRSKAAAGGTALVIMP